MAGERLSSITQAQNYKNSAIGSRGILIARLKNNPGQIHNAGWTIVGADLFLQ
jgi:hypothetical protein